MNKSIHALLQSGLNTFERANDAVLMENPCYDLFIQSHAAFTQVLEHDPNCINAIYYQSQAAGMLSLKSRTDREKLLWMKDCLNSYHHLLEVVSQLSDPTLRSEWQVKSYSNRSEFLESLQVPHAKQSAISDLSSCIQISPQPRFYVRRGRLHLLQGYLLSATDDYLEGLYILSESKKDKALQRQRKQFGLALQKGHLCFVLSELTTFWQKHWAMQFV